MEIEQAIPMPKTIEVAITEADFLKMVEELAKKDSELYTALGEVGGDIRLLMQKRDDYQYWWGRVYQRLGVNHYITTRYTLNVTV